MSFETGTQQPPQAPPNEPTLVPIPTVTLRDPKKRMRFMSFLFLFIISLYAARLVEFQIIQGPSLAKQAKSTRVQTDVLPAQRGTITDVNGVVLSTTIMSRDVVVDQTQIKRPAVVAGMLAPFLNMPKAVIQKKITGKRRFAYVAKQVPIETWKRISAAQIVGVSSEPNTTRLYPTGTVASTLLGYVGADGHGLGGLEYALDKELSGKDGSLTVEQVNGREIPTSARDSVDPVNGTTFRLTINSDLQAVAETALAAQVKLSHAVGGQVVVMDPKTFTILAMASAPVFDPNQPFKTPDSAKRNSTVTDVFEPGSTAKIMTLAAVIEEKKSTPTTKYVIPSKLHRADRIFHDDIPHGVWHLTLNGILAKSSNMGTILASEKIGKAKFYSYLKKFGIGEPTGLKFPGESSGLLPKLSNWSGSSFPTIAFGQGLSVTALQVASVYSTIANDGVRYTPTLVAGSTDSKGTFTPTTRSDGVRVISPATAKSLRMMLESVVSAEGTAPQAQIAGYHVAGKTGTANRIGANGTYSGYTASFVGMAPAENPSLVVAVMIQRPQGAHFGSLVAAPVFKTVMTFALAQQRIPPSPAKLANIPVKW